MSTIDIEKLLEPISEEAPAGENLEDFSFDPEFIAFQQAAQGTPERVMGDVEVAAEPPHWPDIEEQALALLARAKSVAVSVVLTQALMARQGMSGLAQGLELTAGLLAQFWDTIHPELDAEDDDDPTERLNALSQLAGSVGITVLREVPVLDLGGMGGFTVRDFLWASGKQNPPASQTEPIMELSVMSAMMADCELEQLQSVLSAIEAAQAQLAQIEATVADKVGATYPFDLMDIVEPLKFLHPFVAEALARRGVVVPGLEVEGQVAGAAPSSVPGDINSRDDVIRMLDRACEYFNRNEPSSPIPLLLQRAKRLVAQDFMSILKDIAPDALSQLETVSGRDPNAED